MMTVEELAALDARLSANADKLIGKREKSLFHFSTSKAGRKPASFCNCILPEIQEVRYMDEESWPLWVDDAVSGVARLDWYRVGGRSVPLSKASILKCFACLEEINASTISHLLNIGERQAQRYMKACELLHERLVDNFCDDNIRSMRYPAVFIYPRENVPQTDLKED
uniref:RNA polymerase sigma factor n=2 Tax=unclassified bacterial viruses TaxID=12333 RepID=A0AAU6VZK4_9VIRU